MSPSINGLFGAPESEAPDDWDFDVDKLMSDLDNVPRRFTSEEEAPQEPEPEPPPEQEGSEEEQESAPQQEAPEAPAPESPPEATVDPLGLFINEAVAADPSKRDRVLAALRDQAEVPQAPRLPEDIEEGSVAARLWQQNQDTQAQLAQLAQNQKAQAESQARQAAAQAADAAGKDFAAKYPQLDNDEVIRIAQIAGNSGLAARLANGADDLKGAYVQALESTLWTNETYRNKVMTPAEPSEPTVAETDKAESTPRKRKLTALSSAASPTSAPAQPASRLETRPDGRLMPDSKLRVVGELASKLQRERNEGGY